MDFSVAKQLHGVQETEANLEMASVKTRVYLKNKRIVTGVRVWNLFPWCNITSDVICTMQLLNSVKSSKQHE